MATRVSRAQVDLTLTLTEFVRASCFRFGVGRVERHVVALVLAPDDHTLAGGRLERPEGPGFNATSLRHN
jgi:hypothetical protein